MKENNNLDKETVGCATTLYFVVLVQIFLIAMKIADAIDSSWWLVLTPFWAMLLFTVFVVIMICIASSKFDHEDDR